MTYCCAAACHGALTRSVCARAVAPSPPARVLYLVLLTVAVVVALVLRYWGASAFVSLYSFQFGCVSDACYGNQAVYRVSFALLLFFAFSLLTSFATVGSARACGRVHYSAACSGRDPSALPPQEFSRGWWGVKLLLFVVFGVGAFFIPSPFFETCAARAPVAAAHRMRALVLLAGARVVGFSRALG